MTVYIVQDLGHLDFAAAREFGDIKTLVKGRIGSADVGQAAWRIMDNLVRVTRADWLIPAGHPSLIAFAGIVMAERTGTLRMLVWDRNAARYIPMEIRTDVCLGKSERIGRSEKEQG
jgi:hypothetical protein